MALNIKRFPCANQNFRSGRPSHLSVEAIVIHIIDGSQAAADATFADAGLTDRRSAHYSVGRNGEIHQYVAEQDTAYHCGVVASPTWTGLKRTTDGSFINPNFYTIGIEHEARERDDWPDAMYHASAQLIQEIAARYPATLLPLTRQNLVMHREIRATKTCPGFVVDLTRLMTSGNGAPPAPRSVMASSNVNVRRGAPSRQAPVVRVIPAGEIFNVKGVVTGDSVSGISRWYQNMDDDFVWAGAVSE